MAKEELKLIQSFGKNPSEKFGIVKFRSGKNSTNYSNVKLVAVEKPEMMKPGKKLLQKFHTCCDDKRNSIWRELPREIRAL